MLHYKKSLHLLFILFCGVWSLQLSAKDFPDGLPKVAETIQSINEAQIQDKLSCLDLHHIEGIWTLTESGSRIAIIRNNAIYSTPSRADNVDGYLMILLYSSNRAIKSGTILGRVKATAQSGEYVAKMYDSCIGNKPCMPKKYIFRLDNTGDRLIFEKQKSAFGINLWRMVPYLWRHTVYRNENKTPHHGCLRIYPAPSIPHQPVYL